MIDLFSVLRQVVILIWVPVVVEKTGEADLMAFFWLLQHSAVLIKLNRLGVMRMKNYVGWHLIPIRMFSFCLRGG